MASQQLPVAVLGAGSWGTALALLIAKNGHSAYLWGRDATQMAEMRTRRANLKYLPDVVFPDGLNVATDLSFIALEAQTIFLAIPSQGFHEMLIALKPYLHSHHQLIIATKGLDPISGDFLTEITQSMLGQSLQIAVLSGPTFAGEVAAGQPSAITLASSSDTLAETVIALLHNTFFRVYRTSDMKGVQVGGAVKNILAIATGIAEGLGFGANTESALITRGLAEMVRLGLALGGQLETFLGLAGVGDLILTATNNQSRNRRFGILVGQGVELKTAEQRIHQVVEGAHNAKQVFHLAVKHQVDMPIVTAVYQVLKEEISPVEAVNQLLVRTPKMEGG